MSAAIIVTAYDFISDLAVTWSQCKESFYRDVIHVDLPNVFLNV